MKTQRACCPYCSHPLSLRQLVLLSPWRDVRCRACARYSVPHRLFLALSSPLFAVGIGLPALAARQGDTTSGLAANMATSLILLGGFVLYLLAIRRWLRLTPKKRSGHET